MLTRSRVADERLRELARGEPADVALAGELDREERRRVPGAGPDELIEVAVVEIAEPPGHLRVEAALLRRADLDSVADPVIRAGRDDHASAISNGSIRRSPVGLTLSSKRSPLRKRQLTGAMNTR